LLDQVGIPHEVIVSDADETIDGPPDTQVQRLALRKAYTVRDMVQDEAIIIAADTLVYAGNKVLGKPGGPEDALKMLSCLSGRGHTVYTGVAILAVGNDMVIEKSFVESAQVYFRTLTDDEIWAYIKTGEPFDKAGAYGVQDKGALLVDRVEGDYFTVVGLPVARLAEVLREVGYEVWQ